MVEGAAVVAVSAMAVERRNPEMTRQLFDKEFSAQISALKRLNCPRTILKSLEKKRPKVIARASRMVLESKRALFLSVIPASQISIAEQMWTVKNGDIQGCVYLDITHIIDLVETPREPYFMFSVEDGERTIGWTPLFGEKVFKAQSNRRGLSVVEAISLCRHTDTLKHHNVDAIWSRLKRKKVPFLWLLDKEPRIGADRACASSPRWGIPSCSITVI